jgi:DNA-binding GntR family transcriptional regulator
MDDSESDSLESVPHFQRIVDDIRKKIRGGSLAEHAALPSERVIGELFGVSRMTARRALVAIEIEGLAYSSGRKGRFVSPKRLRYDIGSMVSFSATAEAKDIGLTIKLIDAGVVQANSELADKLDVALGAELFKYTRLFLIHGHPTFIEVEYCIAELFPGLLDFDLQQSIMLLFNRNYNVSGRTGSIVIRMRSMQKYEANLLGLASYNAGIELEQTTFDQDGRPFCFDRQIWRGELAEFTALAVAIDTTEKTIQK